MQHAAAVLPEPVWVVWVVCGVGVVLLLDSSLNLYAATETKLNLYAAT